MTLATTFLAPFFLYVLHLVGLFFLVGWTFYAFAGPAAETKKRVMMLTGIGALLVVVAGFGILGKHTMTYLTQGWLIVKILCWLALSALPGIAYRRPAARGALAWVAIALVAVAVFMVYRKPF